MTLFATLLLVLALPGLLYGGAPDAADVAVEEVKNRDAYWQRIQSDPVDGRYTSRGLFRYALAISEAGRHLDRLDRIFNLAANMQQRNPDKPNFGNFHWYSDRPEVRDLNAVEFCMEAATIIWLRHRQEIPGTARKKLRTLLDHAVEACMNRGVGPEYTNISLMNAGNLIRLGEGLTRPEVTEEGYRRLRQFGWYTWQYGIHEFASSTYYKVDLTTLQLIERFSERESARRIARALMKLIWTDVAASWFSPANRLIGSNSRTYDFLHNHGGIRRLIRLRGWKTGSSVNNVDLLAAYGEWTPSGETLRLHEKFPRRVRASWGKQPRQSRSLMVHRSVTLGVTSAGYHAMDVPMVFDLAGGPGESLVRGHFRPDGRNDPYGQNPYDIGSGHHKARHLRTFWTAAQRRNDALGLCVYRLTGRERSELNTLKSHFVLPRNIDGVWIGNRKLDLNGSAVRSARRYPVDMGKPLVVRQGNAAAGIKVLFARKEDGTKPRASLVDGTSVFEAETGTVTGDVRIRTGDKASGGEYVYAGNNGVLRIPLTVDESGTYTFRGRIIAPDGKSNSFFVRLTSGDEVIVPRSTWHTGHGSSWRWSRMELENSDRNGQFHLPEGNVTLELHTREQGTRIDKLVVGDDSGNEAMRLTVDHTASERTEPGAAGFWVRIGHDLTSDDAFRKWRETFERTDYSKSVSDREINMNIQGRRGQVRVRVESPYESPSDVHLTPSPYTGVLEVNGRDRGREILGSIPPFNRYSEPDPVRVDSDRPVTVEAETGAVIPPLHVKEGSDAMNNKYVKAGRDGDRGLSGNGRLRIPLSIQKSGTYYLWGRVIAPNSSSDSFFVQLKQDRRLTFPEFAWHTNQSKGWTWRRISPKERDPSRGFRFSEGKLTLDLLGREIGTKLDALYISHDPDAKPE